MKIALRLTLVALALGLALPASAAAVLAGTNGRIAFTSGREGGDEEAKLFLRVVTDAVGSGEVGSTFTEMTGTQHRHPTWSPDRTQVAYARGSAATEDFDIYVHDLSTGVITPLTDPEDGLSADRPAWSPDGTRIAYEHQPEDGSADRDIRVHSLAGGELLDLTTGSPHEGKPAWSSDSQTLYYSSGDIAANSSNIMREPANGLGTATLAVPDTGQSEFQPAISPDGASICFTVGSGFDGTADVFTSSLVVPGEPTNLSDNAQDPPTPPIPGQYADYNCTWSPDGTLIAYVRGSSDDGALVMERADDTSPEPIVLEDVADVFDGNPDWAPDGRPECGDATVSTAAGTPVTIALDCFDTGPAYERSQTAVDAPGGEGPANGSLGAIQQGPPQTVTYTPNPGFTGTDAFSVRPTDAFGPSADRGRVTVEVVPQAAGPAGPVSPPPIVGDPRDTARPRITQVVVSPRRWKRGRTLPQASAMPTGTTIRWRMNEAARVTLTFQRSRPGRRLGRRCLKATRRLALRPRCTRVRSMAALTIFSGHSGVNRLRFRGRLPGRTLPLGTYRVALEARDTAGNVSATRYSKTFRIVRPRR
jgi:Tol biopolymer transport system component